MKKFLLKHKGLVFGFLGFLFLGLIALFLGLEIQNNWHLLRNFVEGGYATTMIIILAVGGFAFALLLLFISNFYGDKEKW